MGDMNRSVRGVQITVRVSPVNRREFLQSLEGLRERSALLHPDCTFEYFEDLEDMGRITWTEWWLDAGDLRSTLSSDRFRALLGAARTLGCLESIYELDRHLLALDRLTGYPLKG
jgi:quinol monooxygenase YgiN